MRRAVVVETNVLATANLKADHVGPDCVLTCVDALEKIKRKKVAVIDSGMRILDEYLRYASLAGRPNVGDAFLKWLWNNQANPKHCERVEITPRSEDQDDFSEFPSSPDLSKFDRADRKFVAVALASKLTPKVLNATDSDWYSFQKPLEAEGVQILFLCPSLFE